MQYAAFFSLIRAELRPFFANLCSMQYRIAVIVPVVVQRGGPCGYRLARLATLRPQTSTSTASAIQRTAAPGTWLLLLQGRGRLSNGRCAPIQLPDTNRSLPGKRQILLRCDNYEQITRGFTLSMHGRASTTFFIFASSHFSENFAKMESMLRLFR